MTFFEEHSAFDCDFIVYLRRGLVNLRQKYSDYESVLLEKIDLKFDYSGTFCMHKIDERLLTMEEALLQAAKRITYAKDAGNEGYPTNEDVNTFYAL